MFEIEFFLNLKRMILNYSRIFFINKIIKYVYLNQLIVVNERSVLAFVTYVYLWGDEVLELFRLIAYFDKFFGWLIKIEGIC